MAIPHRDDVTKTPYVDLTGSHDMLIFSLVWRAKTIKLESSRAVHASIKILQGHHSSHQGALRMAYTKTMTLDSDIANMM
jgi:hypothetical protein